MQWYYVKENKQQGPLDESQFKTLCNSGRITDKTLVWNQNMTDWQPLEMVKDQISKKETAGAPVPSKQDASLPEQSAPEETETEQAVTEQTDTEQEVGSGEYKRLCSECGKAFADEELVAYHGRYICAGCKPVFLQKLREGVATGDMVYAGFWIRFVAKVIDGLILGAVNLVITVGGGFLSMGVAQGGNSQGAGIAATIIILILYYGFVFFYGIWFVGKYGATPGKMALGLKIVTPENEKVTYLRATGRFFAEILSMITFYVGYIMAGFDDEKRSLHDRVCATRVVKK